MNTWHKSLKGKCIREHHCRSKMPGVCYVEHCNNVRLNSAIGYITPKDMLAGRQQEIHASRRSKPTGIGSGRRRGNNGRFVAQWMVAGPEVL